MRIAQVAPLYESVPPRLYGGTERVVSYLTEVLVELGHDVTLYASGDSLTRARLRPACGRALRLDKSNVDPFANHVYLTERVFQEADDFELVHSHIDYLAFPLWRRLRTSRLTTLHGRLDIPNLRHLYREFADEPIVSISNHQRLPLSWAGWQATVYHGLPESLYHFHDRSGKYLAFLGRISPEKRVDHAVEVARRSGLPLKIAAKVDNADLDYFKHTIEPLLDQDSVEFIGEIGETEKQDFLGNALALLFLIDWPEPFGLAMIEALACGTPVIARARGSVPEVIEHGKTGFVIKDVEEAACAARNLSALRRKDCRQSFEQRFTATRMAKDYVAVYERLVEARRSPRVKPKRKPSRATPEREAQPDGPPKRHLRRPSFLLNERDH